MEKFTKLTSKAIPLPIKDVDTDMIIPAQYMTSTDSSGYGEYLFERLKKADDNFPLNLSKYQDAKILVARNNFGCGSSREHAVWALTQWGLRVIVAPSFADIFFGNAPKNGLVLVKLQEDVVEEIIKKAQAEDYEITVSLEDQKVVLPDGREFKFEFDPFRRDCILQGLDDLGYIQSHDGKINNWNESRRENIFYSTLENNN